MSILAKKGEKSLYIAPLKKRFWDTMRPSLVATAKVLE